MMDQVRHCGQGSRGAHTCSAHMQRTCQGAVESALISHSLQEQVHSSPAHWSPFLFCCPQVQGGLCASTSIEQQSPIQLWDVSQNSWNLAATVWDPPMQFANSLSFEKPLNRLVAGCGDRNMRVWDLTT